MLSQDITIIRQHFVDNFRDDVPVIYANLPEMEIEETATWVRFSVRAGETFHSAGSSQNGVMIQQGRVWLQVFQAEQTGDLESLEIIDHFSSIFRNKRLDGTIHFATEDIDVSPVLTDGYTMITVSIPWESFRRLTAEPA